jgi:hypothetical protein
MMDGEERTTKYAEGAKREAKLLLRMKAKGNVTPQVGRLKEKTCAIAIALQSSA